MSSLISVYTEFSSRLSSLGEVVVAGGAVRDTLLGRKPKDFDVFVLANRDGNAPSYDDIKAELGGLPIAESLFFWHKSEPFLVQSVYWEGAEVQVLSSPCTSVDSLLDSFDWNVSLFAFNGTIVARTPLTDIAPGKELKLQCLTYPASTLRRGFRFSERFGMQFPSETVKQICKAVTDG